MARNCSIKGCKKTVRCRGWCTSHYNKWRRWGDPLHVVERQTVCSVEGCDGKVSGWGYCKPHYHKNRTYGDPLFIHDRYKLKNCSVPGCKKKYHSHTYCRHHYNKWERWGDPLYVVDPEETKKKQSKSVRKAWANPELREKQSKKIRSVYADGSLAKKISEHHSTPEMKKVFQDILKQTRKNMGRPNIPEKTIGKILEEIGIKVKFLQDIDYKTLENKLASKEMDIVWKDSMGNKKIIEYNGYYHFDNRKYGPDEIHEVHGKPTVVKDLWDNEEMILNQIRKAGYRILIVWEKDFLKDNENEVKRIIEFATKT